MKVYLQRDWRVLSSGAVLINIYSFTDHYSWSSSGAFVVSSYSIQNLVGPDVIIKFLTSKTFLIIWIIHSWKTSNTSNSSYSILITFKHKLMDNVKTKKFIIKFLYHCFQIVISHCKSHQYSFVIFSRKILFLSTSAIYLN